jgi:hypothetical protein
MLEHTKIFCILVKAQNTIHNQATSMDSWYMGLARGL